MSESRRRQRLFHVVGDVCNVFLFVSTLVVSYCMLYRYPNISYFDETWLENGFCVSNAESKVFNSHCLSFYSDTIMSVALAAIYFYYFQRGQEKKTKTSTPTTIKEALALGAISNVFFHGVAHLYYGAIDPTGFDLKWSNQDIGTSIVSQMVVIGGLSGIFKADLPLGSNLRVVSTAIAGAMGLTLFNVPSVMNFVYLQGVIFLASSAHMLTLAPTHKQTATYLLYPILQFPVLAIGVLESTRCQQLLAPLGGHAIFDTAISVGFLLMPVLATHLDPEKKKTI